MSGRVNGKIALVTGGSSGIGRACAMRLAAEGAQVVIGDIDDERGDALVGLIGESGGRARYVHLDVTQESQWRDVVATLDHLDILVNNAGIGISSPSIVDFPLDQWRRQQAINVDGVFLGVKYCLPLMRHGGGGSIVNMSSIGGIAGSALMSSYCTTKAAVRLFTKSIAIECANRKDGVRVNSVHPGLIDTAIWDSISASNPDAIAGQSYTREGVGAIASSAVPLGHLGSVEDIAAGVLYLASDEARYMTGAELVIDGGMTAQ